MKSCPVCRTKDVGLIEIEKGLSVRKCYGCHGIWLPSNCFLTWKRSYLAASLSQPLGGENSKDLDDISSDDATLILDSSKALLCPDCGTFLRRYKIAPTIVFSLDRCSSCNGVWLDRNEWTLLKQYQLHERLNEFFTEPWQRWIFESGRRQRIQEMYRDELGDDDYVELQRIRQWVRSHPRHARLIAYLMDCDPYTLGDRIGR